MANTKRIRIGSRVSRDMETVETLLERYRAQDDCLGDFLAEEPVPSGVTYGDAVRLWAEALRRIEGDTAVRLNAEEGWAENLAEDGHNLEADPVLLQRIESEIHNIL